MSLAPGTRLGSYEIVAAIGRGGMGEVFRARDTQLGRDVAIKILPESFARDADRIARFRREAQALAALNDPHIAQIYQLEESPHSAALVMEFVDGRTLADLIAASSGGRGLALDDALALAAQVAAGLEVAHERGIVHRDLKPANVKVTPDGRVKLLDFGLAKALGADAASGELMNSPTLTARATEAGMLLGTAAYMSPEQARGRPVDKRTDIWAFGAVLFELLTGRRLFDGETVSDTVAAVLRNDPDWTQLPADTPAHVRTLLARCLERDPSRRLRDIGEARVALDTARAPMSVASPMRELSPAAAPGGPSGSLTPASSVLPPRANRRWQVAAAVLALTTVALAAGAVWLATRRAPAALGPSLELAITAPPDGRFEIGSNSGNVMLSPDGTRIAFAASTDGTRRIWIRSLAADDARPLSGTENGAMPFWSPDGRRIGFFAIAKLLTVDISGGLPESIADATAARGAAWNRDGTIVFAAGGSALWKVSATGGPVTPVTTLDASRGENAHYWPVWLPDGQRLLYFARSSSQPEINGIYIARLDGSTPPTRVVASLSSGILSTDPATGQLHLLWVRDGDLLAQRFDGNAGALLGDAVVVARDVLVEESQRLTFASASNTGVLAWASARAASQVFSLYSRDGQLKRVLGIPPGGRLDQPAFSPDGRRLLFQRVERGASDIHVHDLQTGVTRSVTSSPGFDELGNWTPDSRAILYLGYQSNTRSLLKAPLDAGTPHVEIYRGNTDGRAFETPDGRFVIVNEAVPGGRNIVAVPLNGSTPATLAPSAIVLSISGDGRWLVTSSNRGGRFTAGVARLYTEGDAPRLGEMVPIEGAFAIRRDAREVYTDTPARGVQVVPIETSEHTLRVSAARTLTKLPAAKEIAFNGDGTEFVALEQPYAAGQTLRIVTNWPQRLTQ